MSFESIKYEDSNNKKNYKESSELIPLAEKQKVILETRDSIDKEALINESKTLLYEKLGINFEEKNNSKLENFLKGIVDTLVFDNYDLAVEIYNTNGKIIIDSLKQLANWDNLKQIASSIGDNIITLFSGNPYEKGKSVAELGLVGTGLGAGFLVGKKAIKLGIKEVSKLRINSESIVTSKEVKKIIGETKENLDSVIPKKEFDLKEGLSNQYKKPTKEEVLSNSSWLERGDLNLPNNILKNMGLKELTPDQMKIVEKVHTDLSNGVYRNITQDLMAMTRILREAGITKEQVRQLMEKGITGEFKFDSSFFSGVTELQSKISRGSLQEYLDGFAGKDLNLEQLSVVIREDIKRFSDFQEFSDFLDLYDITPPSKELFFLAKKGADTILHRDLLLDPKKISINDLDYFQKVNLGFDDLFSSFIKSGDKIIVNDFFEKLNNSNLDIKLTDISSSVLNDLLNTNLIDKSKLSKFILNYSGKNLSPENLQLLKKHLDKNGSDLFTQDLLRRVTTEIEVKLDKFNPNNIIKSYLEGIDLDFSTGELLVKNSASYRTWNSLFESSFDERFNMIYRGKQDFFHDLNLDRFFHFTIHELTQVQKGKLYELVKEGGEYFDRIKGYKEYENIVELLKKSYDKTK